MAAASASSKVEIKRSITAKSNNGLAKAFEPFVCGGSAATFASVVIHPIDLAKVSQIVLLYFVSRNSHRCVVGGHVDENRSIICIRRSHLFDKRKFENQSSRSNIFPPCRFNFSLTMCFDNISPTHVFL